MMCRWVWKFGLFFVFLTFHMLGFAINIVAAENFYGDIAQQIGGKYVKVRSILNDPAQDPHLFNFTPSLAKAILESDLLIYNGLGYDAWIETLASQLPLSHQLIIANLMGAQRIDNPHLWYKPETSLYTATAILQVLKTLDVAHQSYYEANFERFKQAYDHFGNHLKEVKSHYANTKVLAAESAINYLLEAVNMPILNLDAQLSITNGIPLSPNQMVYLEKTLTQHQVKLFIYNKQVVNPIIDRLNKLATQSKVPTLGIYEIMPPHQNFFSWMNNTLDEITQRLQSS